MHPDLDDISDAARVLVAHSERFRALHLALCRFGLPYTRHPAALDTSALSARDPAHFVRAATMAAEREDAAEYFLRSAAHESMASGDFTIACVGAARSAASLDSLLASFVARLGIWVSHNQCSFDHHVCPVAGILAAYLHLHHVHVPLAPAIGLGPPPGEPVLLAAVSRPAGDLHRRASLEAYEAWAPVDLHVVGTRVCAPPCWRTMRGHGLHAPRPTVRRPSARATWCA